MSKKAALFVFVSLLVVFELFIYSTNDSLERPTPTAFKVKPFKLAEKMDFCGEEVPLYSQDIKERFEREILKNAHWHSEMTLLYKRTGRYFPLIEKILAEEGIPDDFKYICIIESGLSNVVSPAGAAGFWQIMKKTGQEFGLEVNRYVDERYHLEKATRVACAYFKKAHERFGNWTLAAASYNIGMAGLARRLKKQKVSNYYDLLLNTETSRYVFRVLALKEIMSQPEKYNFEFQQSDQYKAYPYRIATVDTTVYDLSSWSQEQGINYKMLKIFNPWLKNNKLPNADSTKYQIKIPTDWVFKFSKTQNDSASLKQEGGVENE